MASLKVIIIPGNGCTDIQHANWYWWAAEMIRSTFPKLEVICETFPDPYEAKESIWVPFIREKLRGSKEAILIGHSSGAQAAMRYLEKYKAIGAILVSACWTDLGEESERISGYYDRPWQWEKISSNAGWIVQFGSSDDPFIPIEEMRHVANNIQSEYIEHTDRGHYMTEIFPELIQVLKEKLHFL